MQLAEELTQQLQQGAATVESLQARVAQLEGSHAALEARSAARGEQAEHALRLEAEVEALRRRLAEQQAEHEQQLAAAAHAGAPAQQAEGLRSMVEEYRHRLQQADADRAAMVQQMEDTRRQYAALYEARSPRCSAPLTSQAGPPPAHAPLQERGRMQQELHRMQQQGGADPQAQASILLPAPAFPRLAQRADPPF